MSRRLLYGHNGFLGINGDMMSRNTVEAAPEQPDQNVSNFTAFQSVAGFNISSNSNGLVQKIDATSQDRNDGIISNELFDMEQPIDIEVTISALDSNSGLRDYTWGLVRDDRKEPSYGNFTVCGTGVFNNRMNTRYHNATQNNNFTNYTVQLGDTFHMLWRPSQGTYGQFRVLINATYDPDTQTYSGGTDLYQDAGGFFDMTEKPTKYGRFQLTTQGDNRFTVRIRSIGAGGAILPPDPAMSSAVTGSSVTFDATQSQGRLGATIVTYQLQDDLGNTFTNTTGLFGPITYPTEGSYYPRLFVTDSNGLTNDFYAAVVILPESLTAQWTLLNSQNIAKIFEFGENTNADPRSADQILNNLNSDGSFSDIAMTNCNTQMDALYAIWRLALDLYAGGSTTSTQFYQAAVYWMQNENVPDIGQVSSDNYVSPGCDWTEGFRSHRVMGFMSCLVKDIVYAERSTGNLADQYYNLIATQPPKALEIYNDGSADNFTGANASSRYNAYFSYGSFLEDTEIMRHGLELTIAVFKPAQGTGFIEAAFANSFQVGPGVDWSWWQHNIKGGMFVWGNYGTVGYDQLSRYLTMLRGTVWNIGTTLAGFLHNLADLGLNWTWYNATGDGSEGSRFFRMVMGRNAYRRRPSSEALGFIFDRMAALGTSVFTAQQIQTFQDISDLAPADTSSTTKSGSYFFFAGGYYFAFNIGAAVPANERYALCYAITGLRMDGPEQGIQGTSNNYDFGYFNQEYYRQDNYGEDDALPLLSLDWFEGGTSLESQYVNKTNRALTGPTLSSNTLAGGLCVDPLAAIGGYLDRDHIGNTLKGYKSFFAFSDMWLYMGTGIMDAGAGSFPAVTGIIKSKKFGAVYHNLGGTDVVIAADSYTAVQDVQYTITSPAYIWHNNTGRVIIPRSGQSIVLRLTVEQRSGNWSTLGQLTGSQATTQDCIELLIEHGEGPTDGEYCWIQFKAADLATTQAAATTLPVDIVSQEDDCHAVYHDGDSVFAGIWYAGGRTVQYDNTKSLSMSAASIIVMEENGATFNTHVCDPQYLTPNRIDSVTARYRGQNTVFSLNQPYNDPVQPRGKHVTNTDIIVNSGSQEPAT